MPSSNVRFAFLALREHPYAAQMLHELLAYDFAPALIIEEDSAAAAAERDKFLERMAGFVLAPALDLQPRLRDVPRLRVDSHNDAACQQRLEAERPELIVLGGTRILRPEIFAPARRGTLNAHPGLLPEVRGSASVAWAIELDIEVGCTCHFVEAGIDTGPIVGRRTIDVHAGDTYEKLCHATTTLSAVLMREALQAFAAGTLAGVRQSGGDRAHKNMPPAGVAKVKRKLAEGRYPHMHSSR